MLVAISFTTGDLRVFCTGLCQRGGHFALNPQNRRFPDWTPDTTCNVPDSLTWFEYRVAALRAFGALIPRHTRQLDRELVRVCSYFAAVLVVGIGFVRRVGIPRHQEGRLRKFTIVPYLSAILLASVAGLLNPLGIQLLWQSALPATAGGQSGLLWLQYYIPRQTEPNQSPGQLARSYVWIVVAAVLGIVYVVVLGRGITLCR